MTDATLPEAVRIEAAKSLVDRLREKTALTRFFRYNASAKHGVPVDPVESASLNVAPQQQQQPVAPMQPTNSAWTPGKVIAAGLLSAAALTGAGGLGYYAATRASNSTKPQVRYESPYQYLEDQGAHLP